MLLLILNILGPRNASPTFSVISEMLQTICGLKYLQQELPAVSEAIAVCHYYLNSLCHEPSLL